jgi:hypothetical protein
MPHAMAPKRERSFGWRLTNLRIAPQHVATKLRCHCLCKVEMSLGGIGGSVSRRRGDHHIGAAPASPGGFRLQFGGFSNLKGAVL